MEYRLLGHAGLMVSELCLGCMTFGREADEGQSQYSLVERHIEYELLPLCQDQSIGIIPWSPLGGGFLSGKYKKGEQPPQDTRISRAAEQHEEAWKRRATERNWRVLDIVGTIAEATKKSYAQIALNWLLRQPAVTAPIIGARTLEQLEDNLGAVGWQLSSEQVKQLTEAGTPEELYPYRFIRNAQRV